MAPASAWTLLHQSNGVVLLLIAADKAGDGVGITVGIAIQIVCAIAVNHFLSHITRQCDGQCGSQVEGRTQRRAPCRVGIDTCAVCAHIREVGADVEFVQERALLRVVKHIELVVRADGQTVVVRLAVVTTDDTVLCVVTQ